ncbi:hypothetical protein quinque_005431 [Culex quinquefasciatus]
MKIKAAKKTAPKATDAKLHQKVATGTAIAKPGKQKKNALPAATIRTTLGAAAAEGKAKKKNKQEKLKQLAETVENVAPKVLAAKKQKAGGKPKKQVLKPAVAEQKTVKKEEKGKNQSESLPEGVELPETLVKKKTIKTALQACKKALDDGFEKKKNLFGEEMKYGLQISAVKIPQVPKRNCRMQLPHPIYHKGDDICLIVKDLARGSKFDHEETLRFWEDKLRDLGVNFITQIIPFQQLKQDYRQYEMKTKLVHRFDRFLVDSRMCNHAFAFLGNAFIKRCKNPTPVVLEKDEQIVENLEKALRRITYRQTNTGAISEIQFATHKMPLEKAVENAAAMIEGLKSQYPGGWLNIRTIHLKPMTDINLTFPLYVSSTDPNLVPVPTAVGPRESFEKARSQKLLDITKNKYKFQAGSLVRVPFEKRRKQPAKKGKKAVKGEAAEVQVEDELESDEEAFKNRERASDTENSDMGSDDE